MLFERAGQVHRVLDRGLLGAVALVLQEEIDAEPDQRDQDRADQGCAMADIRQPLTPEIPYAIRNRHRPAYSCPRTSSGSPLVFRYLAMGLVGARPFSTVLTACLPCWREGWHRQCGNQRGTAS